MIITITIKLMIIVQLIIMTMITTIVDHHSNLRL